MATASGSIGSAGSMTYFTNPVYTGINLSSGYYPNGTITLTGVGGGAYWVNNHINYKKTMKLYLCDSNGNNKKLLFTIEMPGGSATSSYKTSSVKATALEGKKLYLIGEGDSDYIFLRNATGITVTTAKSTFTITCWESTHGYVTASKSSAQAGDTITLTAHPDTGYELTGWDVTSGVTISGSKFTMPSKNVDVTGIFTKKNYTITKKANPSGAGTVTVSISGTSVSAANYGDILTLSQTPAAGSVFTGWTISPNLTITSNAITMPASAITVTANYKRRSTASFGKTTLTGGETALLTISSESTSYTHKYKLSFGTNMETSMTDVAAGVSSVSVEIPESWSNYIPNAATKSGTLTLETYSGTTLIGTYTLSLTYAVPASAVPEIAVPTLTVVRTIDGVTFGNIGDIYAQNHCGVRIQATASGALSSTITGMTITLPGYSGGGSSGSGSIDWTSGLLTISGTQTITITATDSRGRSRMISATIQVLPYQKPSGSLNVFRVNAGGTEDPVGNYASYEITKNYSQIGTNALTVTLTTQGESATASNDSGELLPGHRLTFSLQNKHDVTLTLTDGLETTTITATVNSARFVMFVNNLGTKLGFFKTADRTIPSGKTTTFEISGDTQVYIGNDTLEEFIKDADKVDPVSDPTASGTDVSFIASITQSAKGVITALKKTVRTFGASGSGAKTGLVPSPGTTAGTAKYLREDATWQVPPNTNTWRDYQIVTKTYKWSSASAGATRNIYGSSFGFSTPSGYTCAGIVGFDSGDPGMAVTKLKYTTGDSTLMALKNVTSGSISSNTASVSVLFIKTGTPS